MRKIVSLALVLSTLLCAFTLASCGLNKKEEEFYNLVDETKDLLDIVADDIYS